MRYPEIELALLAAAAAAALLPAARRRWDAELQRLVGPRWYWKSYALILFLLGLALPFGLDKHAGATMGPAAGWFYITRWWLTWPFLFMSSGPIAPTILPSVLFGFLTHVFFAAHMLRQRGRWLLLPCAAAFAYCFLDMSARDAANEAVRGVPFEGSVVIWESKGLFEEFVMLGVKTRLGFWVWLAGILLGAVAPEGGPPAPRPHPL